MTLLHYVHLLYQQTPALAAISTASTPSNKLKLLAALVALLTYKYRSHAIGTRRRPDLKEPKGAVPFFGHMFLMASVHELSRTGSGLVDFSAGIGRMIQGDSPELVEHVLKTNFSAYEKSDHYNTALGDIFGKGIVCADGNEWKHQRKELTQLLTVKLFREYASDALNVETQKVVDHLNKAAASGTVVDFHELMHAFTLDSFGSVLLGETLGCLDNIGEKTPFADAITDLLETASDRLVDPIWKLREALTTVGAKNQKSKNVLRQHIHGIITKHLEEEEKEDVGQDHAKKGKKKTLLRVFMDARDEDGQSYSDNHIVDVVLNLMVASRDTTSEGIAWMMYLLLREEADPELLKTFVKEVDEVLGDGFPTYETHKRQKFAEACFFESLRLFPTIPRNLRLCIQDDSLPDGTRIYAGEWFTWSSYTMGRSERIWGPDALKFKPCRWFAGEKPASLNKYNPFFLGPRACLGQGLAVLQATTIMGLVLRQFEVTLVEPGRLPKYGVGFTLPMIGGLPVRVSRRVRREDVEA